MSKQSIEAKMKILIIRNKSFVYNYNAEKRN